MEGFVEEVWVFPGTTHLVMLQSSLVTKIVENKAVLTIFNFAFRFDSSPSSSVVRQQRCTETFELCRCQPECSGVKSFHIFSDWPF